MTGTINGTNGNDTINGTSKGDTIYAKGGNDTVNAGSGNDFIDAGSGNDVVNAGDGNDEVWGGTGDDTINGQKGSDELHGDDGNDSIDGGDGEDLVDGGNGNDVLKGGAGWDLICGGSGNDTITGGSGNDLIWGGAGTDTAIFSGNYASYDVYSLFGSLLVNGQDGTDLVVEVEYLKFDNGTYNVGTGQFVTNNPTISISNGQAVEGQAVTFTISLSAVTDHDVTVTYFTQAGTATGMGSDYLGTAGTTITIPAGQLSAQISIQTVNDPNVEPDEQFFVNLTSPVGATIADGQGVGTILNNDVAQPHITLTAVTSAVTEGGTIQYVFTRTGGDISSAFDVTWQYNPPLLSGAATPGVDFVDPVSHVIHFAPGQTTATLNFLTIQDGVYEGTSPSLPSTEAFAITFVPDGTYTFTVVSNIATIVDGDPPPLPTLSIADASVNEEAGTITFTVTLSAPAAGPVTFTYSTADGTAGSGDYVGVTNQVGTIAAGQTTTTITIALSNDNIVETGGETFFVNLSNPVGATIADGQAVGTILEQDQLIVGTAGNDDNISNPSLVGGNGDDTIQGLGGDDGLAGGAGNDLLDGGAGFDRAIYTNAGAAVNIQLAAGTATIGGSLDTLMSIEFARGTAFGDVYNAVGFGTGSTNASSQGNNFNAFEGLGGDDQITGNGNTRIEYTNATAGVTVDLSAPALGAPVGATGFATGDLSVGNDTIFGGVTRVRGSNFVDTITGGGANEILEGRGDNDVINGGGGIDIALFTGLRSEYVITPGGVPGSSTVADSVAGRDGTDTLTTIELTEFSNAYNLNQRVLDLSAFGGLAGGKQIFGTNLNNAGAGDNLTLGLNANGRFIDLVDGGTDTLTLAAAGIYNLNLARVEVLAASGGNDSVTLQNAVSGMAVNLSGGSDSLNLANGGNSVTVTGTESIHGGGGFDTVTLGDATPVTINSVESVIGTGGNDQVTINADPGVTTVTASLNLDGGNDTVNLSFFGPGTVANLALTGVDNLTSVGGVQTVNLSSDTGLTSVDLGTGFHTLNLAPGDHDLSVANVFTLNSFGTHNDTINFDAGPAVNQTVNLGFGNDVLNLTGTDDQLSMTISGGSANLDGSLTFTVHDQTVSGNLDLNLLNQQGGATYDLGAGTDSLHLNGNTGFVNVVWVQNVENVDSVGFDSDQVHIVGNSGGITTVTAGGGADLVWASADADHFRFTSTGNSSNDMPSGGQRDVIHDFDAASDAFVFDDIADLDPSQFSWTVVSSGSTDIVLIDIDGGGTPGGSYPGYEMAIQLENHVGTLTNDNFVLLV